MEEPVAPFGKLNKTMSPTRGATRAENRNTEPDCSNGFILKPDSLTRISTPSSKNAARISGLCARRLTSVGWEVIVAFS